MSRRPQAVAALAVCATLTLTACNDSPEAGRPDPAPSTSTTTTTTTTPSPTPTTTWTPEEQQAIDAATARYKTARAAIDKALANPTQSSREPLEAAGLGGEWLIAAIGDVRSLRNDGWYRSGSVKIASLAVESVALDSEQPTVQLKSCVDSAGTSLHFQKDGKPVHVGSKSGRRVAFRAKLVYASPTGKPTKMWFVVEEKGLGKC
ncbi:hypothetical protein FB561_4105 [Kribbella amoyensis]|uniref:Lipoprotein n=1 Tax=Kribbella amoyensis TaxID=996641 RepID=A0A561BVM9_9ACTN|nr:hypothetical protein [Kribbella amoyensis]TWD82954.1 hypothetical protein FB561_4105 [Kribbella amoyensis]